ncbi:tryptophan halogenase family protein [Asticcacaulis solisilvae]|uniref:tryptophan halogenase family protein n=1 Tax=Asticcacaulis solisilvae TaxID=1217274 RepID=UPI003FD7D489
MQSKRTIVILGGGTAGWMCAAALSPLIRTGRISVCLVESDQIATVGVGEATLPHIKDFNDSLGIDEAAFMRATHATFKLGIAFAGWGSERYIHPFGIFGQDWGGTPFQHHWLRARQQGEAAPLEDYSFAVTAASAHRFGFPDGDTASVRSTFAYAYHFDAALYAGFMRDFATKAGVTRTEGRVVSVVRDTNSGDVTGLRLESGATVAGDLFVDCSGFIGLLINAVAPDQWEDWGDWLPCDRAWAVPSRRMDDVAPYTLSIAREAGWQWRIPLQHRTGNGYVFSSRFTSEAEAMDVLMANLATEPLADPKLLKFRAGRRPKSWSGNVVATGLASGFLEPLESTSIYLVQAAIRELMPLLMTGNDDPRARDAFNRAMATEYDRIRDFLILHYHVTDRTEPLWQHARTMDVPDSLKEKLALFRTRAYIESYNSGLFSPPSWLAVLVGQGILPTGYDRTVDWMPMDRLAGMLDEHRRRIASEAGIMASHAAALASYLAPAPAEMAS